MKQKRIRPGNVLPRSVKGMSLLKLLLLLLIFSVTSSSLKASNQKSSRFSMSFKGVKLEKVFDEIEKQSDYQIFYSKADVDDRIVVDVSVEKAEIQALLDQILGNRNLKYKIVEKDIIISKGEQPRDEKLLKIKGTVTDDKNSPVPGATVTIEGTTRGVITDNDGTYNIDVRKGDRLVISFIGMETKVITINDRTVIDIILSSKNEELEDVTVVAFAKQKKESVLGSITTVNPTELKVPSSNLTTALAGRMSGIISYQRSGEPGKDNAEFFIRGVTTFGYKKDPLILIDGVELSSEDLARMQPDDISSFSIMKDATATALYGARGANGVILVTTKEGVEGKAKVSVRFENSLSQPTREVELADPITYMKLHNEAVRTRDPLGVLPYSYEKIAGTKAGKNPYVYPATDWYRELFKDYAMSQRLNFNVSGGGKVARYYLAGTVSKDNGVLNVDQRNNFNSNIDLRKYLLRSNININITKTTEAIVRFHGTFDDYTGPIDGGDGLYNKVMRTNPVLFPAYYAPDETHALSSHILFGNYETGRYINPYADMVKGYKDYSKSLMLAQIELKQDLGFIIDGLSARFLGTTNRYSFFDVSRFYNPFYYQVGFYDRPKDTYNLQVLNAETGTEYLGYSEGKKEISSTFYMEGVVQYNRDFKKHGVSGLLVYTMRNELKANAGDLQKSLPYRNMGVSGRFTYSYDTRYFAEFNFGYNGSERFSKDQRFGFFPSAGMGWYVSKEPFWENLKGTVSKLKLKATYGLVGNDAIGGSDDRFFYLSNVNMDNAGKGVSFGTNLNYKRNGISVSRYENSNISWETAKKANIGLELGLFDKIEIQADIFREDRSNILMDRASIPTTMGLQAGVRANVGEAIGQGLDFSVDYQQYFGKDFWITARGNFTYATSEFKVFEEPDYNSIGVPWRSKVGYTLCQQWGYIAERLFVDSYEIINSPIQNFGEYMGGDIKYKDINNDGQITDLDMVPIGYPTTPEIVYGFGLSVGYKAFDFSCFFQGLARESFWIDVNKTAPFIDNDNDGNVISQNALLKVYADNHWSEENPNLYAMWPRLSTSSMGNNSQKSTWFMHDGAFLRLKSAEIGYSLPQNMINRWKLSSLRFYLSGTNLLTFSKFRLWDPEMGSNGLGYPVQLVVNIGVQVSF